MLDVDQVKAERDNLMIERDNSVIEKNNLIIEKNNLDAQNGALNKQLQDSRDEANALEQRIDQYSAANANALAQRDDFMEGYERQLDITVNLRTHVEASKTENEQILGRLSSVLDNFGGKSLTTQKRKAKSSEPGISGTIMKSPKYDDISDNENDDEYDDE